MSFICSTLVLNLSSVRYLLTFVVLMVALGCHRVNAEECVSVAGSFCHCRTNTGYEIDLRPLKALYTTGPILPLIHDAAEKGRTYSYDPCVPFIGESLSECQHVAMCQKNIDQLYHAVAVHKGVNFSDFQHEHGSHTLTLEYMYTRNDTLWCKESIATVNLECCHDVDLDRNVNVTEDPQCSFTFTLRSKFACIISPPQSKQSLSLGSILLIVFFVGLFLYFVVGLLIQHYVREKRGVEQIPNLTFWVAIPGLVKDGFVFVFTSVGICRRDVYYQSI